MPDSPDIKTETLAETENYMIYTAEEPDGETTWNVELEWRRCTSSAKSGRNSSNWFPKSNRRNRPCDALHVSRRR